MTRGGKNLILLGVASVVIALITSGVSLAVYHNSGDIYLDRSRPGFLPDEQEAKEEDNPTYSFPDNGQTLSADELKEYIDHLSELQEKFNALPDPYSAESLSDGALNISAE